MATSVYDKSLGELYINNKDAWATYGIRMGEDFISNLYTPAPLKDFVESKSRLAHGKRVLNINARLDDREVTLTFNIHGETPELHQDNRRAFVSLLQSGATLQLQVPSEGSEVFRLIYNKSTSYARSKSGTFCKLAVKFIEPNPNNRGKEDIDA